MTLMKSFWKYFMRDMPLKYKFMLSNVLLVLVPTILISVLVVGQLSAIVTNNTMNSEQALVTQTANTLEATVSQAVYAMDSITSNPFLSQATYSGSANSSNTFESTTIDREFFSNLNTLIDYEFIKGIKIYVAPEYNDLCTTYENTGIILPMSESDGSYWRGIFSGTHAVSLFCPSFYLTQKELNDYGKMAYIKRFRNISSPNQVDAYIAIYFSQDHITNILRQNLTSSGSVSYIINSRNCIVASSNTALSGTYYMDYDIVPEKISNTSDFETVEILGNKLYMGYREISGSDWRLISVIPTESVFSEGHSIVTRSLFLYLAFLIVACVLALLLSNNITSRLSSVVVKMNSRRTGTPTKLEDNFERDEIGQLVQNYNLMVDRINELMDEQTESAEKLKVSEVKALQAQINPHFLYNMLDMINWLSQSGKPEQVTEAVQALSKFYKLTLSKKNITVSVKEELSHVSLYVKLQNMRYENKIHFIIDVPDEIMDCEIPKLVLQPIVENSIQHGIFELESKEGTIVIMAWLEEDHILFIVSDTGAGISPEKLPTILDGTGKSETGSNIGIYNTHLRLQLLYGPEYGLHFESSLGKGTEVQVRIPQVRK